MLNVSRSTSDNVPVMSELSKDYLIFSLQGVLYALDLAQIAEVGDPPLTSPVPLAPSCCSGALNFHGDIVVVVDLAVFLGLTGSNLHGKIIVLHQEVASLAFLVDTVVRIVSVEEIAFKPPNGNYLAAATLVLQDCEAIQLDLAALVHAAEIIMQRNQSE